MFRLHENEVAVAAGGEDQWLQAETIFDE